jgi:acetylornithine deacetylase/succinyl-diaminopimelate desuccinylase-like protein
MSSTNAPMSSSEAGGGRVPTDELLAHVRAVFDESGLHALGEYTRIRCLSPAFDPDWEAHAHLDAAAELLRSWCASRAVPGATVEIARLPGRTPVLFAEIPASDPARADSTTLVYGHFDKQPPLGAWREGLDPFTPVREGDRLYGRGTADDGYATFAAFAAFEALAATSTPHGRIVLLVEASEESGSPDLEAHLDALAPRIGTPSLVVCLDSGCVTYDRLWVTTSLRGNLVCTVRVDVLDEGVHSGSAGGIVPSSFRILRQLLARIEDAATGDLLLPELATELPEHRRREIAEVAAEFGEAAAGSFPSVGGLELAGADAAERVERGTWRASLAFIGIDGVPAVRDGGNVLRPFTTAKLSVRLPPTVDAALAARALEKALTSAPPSGARVTVEFEEPATGWDAPAPSDWLREALDDASLACFGAPARSMGLGGSIPFMAALGARFPGTQFLATGVLGPQSNAHGPNEFLHVPTAGAVSAVVAHVLGVAP